MRVGKIEFITRVSERAAFRYGVTIDEGWLADRVKDGLMHRFDREGNEGLSPSYYATGRHYRRALQIIRLESKGIKLRNSQMLQLYMRGYGVSAAIGKTALENVLSRTLSRANSQLKSNHFDKERVFGPKSETIVSLQLGEIDERLKHLELSTTTYTKIAREFRRPRIGKRNNFFTGLLAPGLPFLEMVHKASPQDIDFARFAFTTVNKLVLQPLVGSAISASPELTALLLGMFITWRDEPLPMLQLTSMIQESPAFMALVEDLTRLASPGDE